MYQSSLGQAMDRTEVLEPKSSYALRTLTTIIWVSKTFIDYTVRKAPVHTISLRKYRTYWIVPTYMEKDMKSQFSPSLQVQNHLQSSKVSWGENKIASLWCIRIYLPLVLPFPLPLQRHLSMDSLVCSATRATTLVILH